MSGGQLVAVNVGSFEGAHAGMVHDAAEPPPAHLGARPPPPTLQLPDEDPEVYPDADAENWGALGGGDAEDDEDTFDDENEADQENASPPRMPSLNTSQLEPLGPSASQRHVRAPRTLTCLHVKGRA